MIYQVDYVMVRDLDGAIGSREVAAVKDWLHSDMDLHVMRDHPAHKRQLMGGMWGTKLVRDTIRESWHISWNNLLKSKSGMAWSNRDVKGPDQKFLQT